MRCRKYGKVKNNSNRKRSDKHLKLQQLKRNPKIGKAKFQQAMKSVFLNFSVALKPDVKDSISVLSLMARN